MPTDGSRCLRSHFKFDYGIQGVILSGNITSITAPWSDMLTSNVDLWEIVTIEGKGRGIVTTVNISKRTIIAMYGGVINSGDTGSFIRHERQWKNTRN